MARRNPIEADARELAGEALKDARKRKSDARPYDLFEYAIHSREQSTTWAVQRGDIPAARRQARAAQLLNEAQGRMMDRRGRATARKLAQSGIVPGVRVRTLHDRPAAGGAPAGTVVTLEDDITSPYVFGTDAGGKRWLVYARDVEVLPSEPDPIRESGIGVDRFTPDDTVLTPDRGVGTVEHVDVVSGVTVRVAGGETWRYNPEQLTAVTR